MITGKTITLTRRVFVGKVMSLLFNMLSRLVIAFLPRGNHLLILWLQSPSEVILGAPKIVCHSFHCFPISLPWSGGTRCHDLSFLNWVLSQLFNTCFLVQALWGAQDGKLQRHTQISSYYEAGVRKWLEESLLLWLWCCSTFPVDMKTTVVILGASSGTEFVAIFNQDLDDL